MSLPIEDYALISDCFTGALVGRDGSIDWLCLPRYDSQSTFGALLGTEDHGRWLLAPSDPTATSTRHYERDTMILVTRWRTATGEVEVVDAMPMGDHRADLVRRVRGVSGQVELREELRIRFGYATAIPWVRRMTDQKPAPLVAVAGPDGLVFRGSALHPADHAHEGRFIVKAGQTVDLSMTWFPSHREAPAALDVETSLQNTRKWWTDWADGCDHDGPYREEVVRSLLILRALTHLETGGIVAAATTSLPENFGGERNWDYRYVWLRDASLTIAVLLAHGYDDSVDHWRDWLLRAIAGDPGDVQIMYGLAGERDLAEREIDSLPGYQGAHPVRIGNDASTQFQADVIGEVMLALDHGREAGVQETRFSWALQRALMGYLEQNCASPTTASGRSAARSRCSPTPGCWCGRRSTARSAASSSTAWRVRWSAGGTCATRSAPTWRPTASTSTAARTSSTSARPRWTPRCCCSRRSATAPTTTPGCSAR